MLTFPPELKPKVIAALLEKRSLFDGTEKAFANQFGINPAIFSRLKNGEAPDGLLRAEQWINAARKLDISMTERKWNMARTEVYNIIEEDVLFCAMHSKSRMLVDDCGIGKSFAAKHLSRTVKNCFYVDASQTPGKNEFIRALAKAIGVDGDGKLLDVRANIKYALKMLPLPVMIIDEAGALEDKAAQLLKELWNATEKACGWYMMGAEGLEEKVSRNIRNKKQGWAELFSRFSERYGSVVPKEKGERLSFYRKLITDVVTLNINDKSKIGEIVQKCLLNDSGRISGLRRAEALIILLDAA